MFQASFKCVLGFLIHVVFNISLVGEFASLQSANNLNPIGFIMCVLI
jgi:hypothetical protein